MPRNCLWGKGMAAKMGEDVGMGEAPLLLGDRRPVGLSLFAPRIFDILYNPVTSR